MAYVVDAISSDAQAGTIVRIDGSRRSGLFSRPAVSTHGIGLGETIELGRVLDMLPGRLVIYGVSAVTSGKASITSVPKPISAPARSTGNLARRG